MATPRSLALHDALAAAFTERRWEDVRSLYHDDALLCTVAAHHEVLGPDELMEVFARLDQTAYMIGKDPRAVPIDDHAVMVIASLRYENSMGIAHDQVCWLLTFKDDLVYRSRDYPSEAAARAAYAEHGIDIGIHERT
jgi:hypothetical protein